MRRLRRPPASKAPKGNENGGHRAAVFACRLGLMKTSTSRRLLLAGAGASLLPFVPARAAGLIATPQQTEGPFYPTAFPADMDNDLVQVRGQQVRAMGTVLHLE